MTKPTFPLNKEPLDGTEISNPPIDKDALACAKAKEPKRQRKSFVQKTISRAGKKNKPAERFRLEVFA